MSPLALSTTMSMLNVTGITSYSAAGNGGYGTMAPLTLNTFDAGPVARKRTQMAHFVTSTASCGYPTQKGRKRNKRRRRKKKIQQPPSDDDDDDDDADTDGFVIVFEAHDHDDEEEEEEDDDGIVFFEAHDDEEKEVEFFGEHDDDDEEEEMASSSESSQSMHKKVQFATDLCQVHNIVAWAYAYQAARKGPWEECARDRCRFQRRIQNTGDVLQAVLKPEHRRKVYEERFMESTWL